MDLIATLAFPIILLAEIQVLFGAYRHRTTKALTVQHFRRNSCAAFCWSPAPIKGW